MTPEGRVIRTNILTGAAVVVVLVVALIVVAAFGDGEAVDGPDGSSFVTTPQGTAALFETLDTVGVDVGRLRSPITPDALSDVGTILAIDVGSSSYDPAEIQRLAGFVSSGGRLVVGGRPQPDLVEALLDTPPDWSAATVLNGVQTIGGGTVVSGRFGVFGPGPGIPLVVSGDRRLAVAHPIGEGVLVLVADAAVLSNATLDRAENAAFALGVVGDGPVLFDEFRHGFTEGGRTGLLAAAPDAWVAAGLLAIVAGTVALIVYGRRFGPPEPEGRDLVPSRERLIVAVGSTLRRTGSPVEATEPLRREAIERLRARASLPADAVEADLRAAAGRQLPDDEVDALFTPTADTVVTADRALARLVRNEREGR